MVVWVQEQTAGGDHWVNKGEYHDGFHVVVKSTKAGSVYLVPSGTPRDENSIRLAAVGSADVTAADAETVIAIAPRETKLTHGERYVLYAVDQKGVVSLPTSTVFTVDLEGPVSEDAETKAGGWEETAMMNEPSSGGAAAVLPNGEILVAGGSIKKTVEMYDPSREKWTQLEDMGVPRYGPAAAVLPDGKVLVVGGDPEGRGSFLKSTEVYNPESDSWTAGIPMGTERFKPVAVTLEDGRILVAGGFSGKGVQKSAEIFDPETEEWSSAANMNTGREGAGAVLLSTGEVLVMGGIGPADQQLTSAELYDPASDSWTYASDMNVKRYKPSAVALVNGKVLVVGGISERSAEMYDPRTDTWEYTVPLSDMRLEGVAAPLPDGRVLVAGGFDRSGELATAEIYTPHLQVTLLFAEDVALIRDLDDIKGMIGYSVDGGPFKSLGRDDAVQFSANKLVITLDILPNGSAVQVKLGEAIVEDEAGNPNEELLTEELRY
ncbi:Kelch repeat-containing protein [Brevibacillus borstelensis]|uniref:Kelch repeat-containing protein n=1 Tax=Brevibacillus borstelensis TaxID=45462 RepID=UPI0030C19E4F